MQIIDGRPIARNPILLSEIYFSGLSKGRWKTQTEAVIALSHLRPPVSRLELSRAVGVSRLPQNVLSLFDAAGVWSSTARALVSLKNKYGANELADRAQEIDPRGLTWHQIVKLLDGRPPIAPKRLRLRNTSPFILAELYANGLAAGQWNSIEEAAIVLGLRKGVLVSAISVSQLPTEVLSLFEGKTFIATHGEVLLKISNAIGTDKIVANAREMLDRPKRRSVEQILAHLMSLKEESGLQLRVRKDRSRGATRFVFQFSVEANDADQIITAGAELAPIIQTTLSMLKIKKQKRSA